MHRPKLQTLVYDILPLEEGAGKRCSECGGRCRKAMLGVWHSQTTTVKEVGRTAEGESSRGPSAYQPNAFLPLGQTG